MTAQFWFIRVSWALVGSLTFDLGVLLGREKIGFLKGAIYLMSIFDCYSKALPKRRRGCVRDRRRSGQRPPLEFAVPLRETDPKLHTDQGEGDEGEGCH